MRSETSNFHRQDILHRTFSPLLAAPPMPAKNAQFDIEFFPEGLAEYELRHNPGHDLLRMPKWCAEAQLEKFNAVFAAYSRNPIAILLGAAAIEGYTNYAGHNVCKDWEEFVKGNRRFSEKLRHLFSTGKKAAKLSHRSYQDTMALFKFRGCLAHPRFNHHKEVREGPPPILFDHIDVDYPAAKVFKIVTMFKDSLLKDLDLKDTSWRQSFVSQPGAEPSTRRAARHIRCGNRPNASGRVRDVMIEGWLAAGAKRVFLTSGPTLVTLRPMETHAFGLRLPTNAPEGQKRFPISLLR